MPRVEPLSGIDAAWLAMEDPTNLMMVSGILTFPEPVSYRKLAQVVRRRFLKFDRFRQCVVQPEIPLAARPLMPAYWETVEDFRLEDHLHRVRLPKPAGEKQLQALVSELMSTPLDSSRPLWEMHLIENYRQGSALMVRLHHCIGDGMALVHVLLSIADTDPKGSSASRRERAEGSEESASRPAAGPLEALFGQIFSVTDRVTRLTERVLREGLESLSNPTHLLELAKEGTDSALALQRLFLRSDDPETVFKGPLGVRKLGVWSDALELREVKDLKRVLGGTVNDVLVSAMTGGLRRYLRRRHKPVDGLNLRATIPVNLRKKEDSYLLGNCFGLVFLSLPVGVPDSLERLQIVSRRMNRLKNSREAMVIYGLLSALGSVGKEIQQPLVNLVGAKATAVMTNMIGPPVPLYLAGCRIDEIMFWVPQSARLGLGVSILSYHDKVRLGVATDAALVPDPERIVQGFHQEYEKLRSLARSQARARAGEASATASRPSAKGKPTRCRALTRRGARCRNPARKGRSSCHLHGR